jgi:uncharacterized protein involved in exopolysaccharide biosynthesis
MNMKNQSIINDEINLKDLFLLFWAHKLLIFLSCVIGLGAGGYLALSADKKYISTSVFTLFEPTQDSLSMSQFAGGLGTLAGVIGASPGNTAGINETSLKGRVFVEKIDKQLNLKGDVYFNTYKEKTSNEPYWKSQLKTILKYESNNADPYEVMWSGIMKKYQENVSLDVSSDNIITVNVTHENAVRSAEIANGIMKLILKGQREKVDKSMNNQLNYLSSEVADALSELEALQTGLKTFAIQNKALPLESFALGSIELDARREQLNETIILLDAVSELNLILKKGEISDSDYVYLKNKHPVVEQTDFRRVLGQSESISTWLWPEINIVEAVLATLIERKKRQRAAVKKYQKEAEISGNELEIYGKLKRKEKIAEATYKVLMEQVKVQSMSSGYRPDKSVIYEYASPPIAASEPRKFRYIMNGFLISFIIGCLISLVFSSLKKVYYSKDSIMDAVNAEYIFNAKTLVSLRKKNLKALKNLMIKKSITVLRDLSMEIHKDPSKFVAISSLNTKIKSNDLAWLISSFMQFDVLKIAIINFSNMNNKDSLDNNKSEVFGVFKTIEKDENISILQINNNQNPMDFISHSNFSNNLNILNKSFDLIILCADNQDSLSLMRAVQPVEVFHILLAKTKRSKRKMISQLIKIKTVQGLLYA